MSSFYTVPASFRIAAAVLALAAFMVQTASLLLRLARSSSKGSLLRLTVELTLALYLGISAFLLVSFQDQTLQGGAALTAHTGIRWAGVIPACFCSFAFFDPKHRHIEDVFAAFFIILGLPCFDGLPGAAFAYAYAAGTLFLLCRAAEGLEKNTLHLNNNLSRLSIKEAVDTLHGGVLFSTPEGRIVLQNSGMLNLTRQIFNSPLQDTDELWCKLTKLRGSIIMPTAEHCEKLLIRLPDTAWEFSRETIAAGNRSYRLISAADVTETDRITRELDAINAELEETAGRLRYVLDHYEEIKGAREAVELKRRIHDIMGQRISVLNRALTAPSDTRIWNEAAPLLSDLMRDIKLSRPELPCDVLIHLQRTLALAGAHLRLVGTLPENDSDALLLLQILREAATNAVRHAGAAEITAVVAQTGAAVTMTVTNDGRPPACPIVEGGGITGMRERLAHSGGFLTIESLPDYCLTVTLPK